MFCQHPAIGCLHIPQVMNSPGLKYVMTHSQMCELASCGSATVGSSWIVCVCVCLFVCVLFVCVCLLFVCVFVCVFSLWVLLVGE